MVEHRPTEGEFKKMFDTKMNLVVTVDGITYDNIRFLSDQTGRSMDDLGGMATFYGMGRLITEIEKTIKDSEI